MREAAKSEARSRLSPGGRLVCFDYADTTAELVGEYGLTYPIGHSADVEQIAAATGAFVTVDPPGSRDLDQAMHLSRRNSGYRVRYAIADVASFVRPGGAIDQEAIRRVETLYSPDTRTPLHPPVLSEGAASLLPGQTRPALIWTITRLCLSCCHRPPRSGWS